MKKRLLFILAGCLVFAWTGQAGSRFKIAYVDMNRVINKSNAGLRSMKLLKAKAERSKKYLKDQEREIRLKQEELKNNIMLNEESKKKRQLEINRMIAAFREEVQREERKFRESESRKTMDLKEEIAVVIAKIAEKEKYDLILEYHLKEMVLFSKFKVTDITKKVLAEYNKL
jgi:outer membrane protein